RQRAARPFNQETTVVPEVKIEPIRPEVEVGELPVKESSQARMSQLKSTGLTTEQAAAKLKVENDLLAEQISKRTQEGDIYRDLSGTLRRREGNDWIAINAVGTPKRNVAPVSHLNMSGATLMEAAKPIEVVRPEIVPAPPETTKLYRVESPEILFEDVAGVEGTLGGKFYTSSLETAKAFRESLGRDARIETIDFPTEKLSKFEVRPGEFVIESIELAKKPDAVELGPREPRTESLNPEVLAERLDNYVKSEGDITRTIIRNLETEPTKMVVVPGARTPARALELAREITGEDAIVAVHPRPDGMFDIAVGKKGSPLDNPNNFKQFTEEGYFAGQEISANGKNLIYIGKTGNQAFVRVPGDPRLVKINISDIRRPKDVSFVYADPKGIVEQSAEKQLEGVITPEEIKVFKSLREELHPLEPSTEAKTFDQIRQEASTNGLE
ncbi:hypothetical protein LCGC14_2682400, partial [marine sediment metagenome]